MRFMSSFTSRLFVASALLVFTLFASAPSASAQQDAAKDKKDQVKVPEAEGKLAQNIEKAPDAAGKLQAAEAFLKKYPKSTLRPQIVDYLAGELIAVADNAQKIALSDRYMALFPAAGEGERITPYLVETYIAAQRFDDAYRIGGAWLAKNPNDVRVLAPLSFHAIDLAQKGNTKFVQHGGPYGAKAIELMEAGTKPADMTDEYYTRFKQSWLPQLYQTQGFISISSGDPAGAIVHLQKAIAISPHDPINYYLIGSARDEEYRKMADQYQSMMAGPQKTELMGKINAKLDDVIDNYARVVALSEGRAELKQLHDQILQDMTTYYKYRKGSTDGMQALVDKYKKPATP